jgi:hypothetical protein
MTMDVGQYYRCQNPDFRSEMKVTKASTIAEFNPRCGCGSETKKPYEAPVFKTLDTPPIVFADIQKTRK